MLKVQIEIKHVTLKRFIAMAAEADVTPLINDVSALPCPEFMRVGLRRKRIPATLDEFAAGLTFGQKEFLAQAPTSDVDLILRMFGGYFSPGMFSKPIALKYARKALNVFVLELLPACKRIADFVSALNQREEQLLAADNDPLWIAAGGDTLATYSPLLVREYLASKLQCHIDEVDNKPYNLCLVWLSNRAAMMRVQKTYQEKQLEKAKHESGRRS